MDSFCGQYKWFGFLGITPPDKTNKRFNTVKWIPIISFFVYSCLALFSVYERVIVGYYVNYFHQIASFIKIISEISFIINCFMITIFKQKLWEDFYGTTIKLQEVLLHNNITPMSRKHAKFKKPLSYVLIIATTVAYIISLGNANKRKYVIYFIFLCYTKVFQVTVVSFYQNITFIMTNNYLSLRKVLCQCIKTSPMEKNITKLSEIYYLLNEHVLEFNQICGWQIFFLNLSSISAFLSSLNIFLKFQDTASLIGPVATSLGTIYTMLNVVSTFLSKNNRYLVVNRHKYSCVQKLYSLIFNKKCIVHNLVS